ncbi:MAG: sigma-54-dependent Fis family transcriptional regulator [Spirochaetaceae bacterium]|nr:sigma-54-dependent Fis family transcriptional regulator [Spirochaetaceae bacterium]
MSEYIVLFSGESSLVQFIGETLCGFKVVTFSEVFDSPLFFDTHVVRLLLVDFLYVNAGFNSFIMRLKERFHIPVAVLSTEFFPDLSVFTIKAGFDDYILYPARRDIFETRVEKLLKTILPAPAETEPFQSFIGKTPCICSLKEKLAEYAKVELPVLLEGESGTGKTFLAELIHRNSSRKGKKFKTINLSRFDGSVFFSELVGSVKGAFTDAVDKKGFIEETDGGTLLFDEISEMPLKFQAQLLHLTESNEICRLGSSKSINFNVRFLFATNSNLCERVACGLFRSDLFYRINVLRLRIPPLRERRDDIPLFIEHFLKGTGKYLAPESFSKLLDHSWPGNVRELFNCLKRAVVLSSCETVIRSNAIEFDLLS